MPRVFISHSWDDNEIARKIAEFIKRDGAEIWIDYARIKGGDSLPDRISDALEWCDTLLLIWSNSAANSYYIKLEWQSALDLQKRIITCILDDASRPAILRGLLYLDFKDFEQGYRSLVHALELQPATSELITPRKPTEKPEPKIARPSPKIATPVTGNFRSKPATLSDEEVKAMLKRLDFYDRRWNESGKGVENDYQLEKNKRDELVLDRATGLMWQQSGSESYMTFEAAKSWIQNLKQKGYAGYHNWRLPTLEEAMTLMEPEQMNGDLYINPIFDQEQSWIWTSDLVAGESGRVWVVYFSNGLCYRDDVDEDGYVRAVRSGQSSP